MTALAEDAVRRIRDLNDRLRTTGQGGQLVVSHGLAALGPVIVLSALAAVAEFTAFSPDNDPYGEHDFGALTVAGQTVFFKIDYYDPTLTAGSEDPADDAITRRVMTVMLAEDY